MDRTVAAVASPAGKIAVWKIDLDSGSRNCTGSLAEKAGKGGEVSRNAA